MAGRLSGSTARAIIPDQESNSCLLRGCAHCRFNYVLLCNPVDCSPSGSSVHGDSPGKSTGVGCHAFLQGIFLTQGSNPNLWCLLHWQGDSLPLDHRGGPGVGISIEQQYQRVRNHHKQSPCQWTRDQKIRSLWWRLVYRRGDSKIKRLLLSTAHVLLLPWGAPWGAPGVATVHSDDVPSFLGELGGLRSLFTSFFKTKTAWKVSNVSLFFKVNFSQKENLKYMNNKQQGPPVEHGELCSVSCDKP